MTRIAALLLLLGSGCAGMPETFEKARGGSYQLPVVGECEALVLVFLAHDCPISNAYVPELGRLHEEFGPRGVAFAAVYAEADLEPSLARKHATEFSLPFPALLDPTLSLARRVGATVTPEVAVLSPSGQVLYLGRIDDRYYELRKQRTAPEHRELRDVLLACLDRRELPVRRTEALGCAIFFPPTSESGEKP